MLWETTLDVSNVIETLDQGTYNQCGCSGLGVVLEWGGADHTLKEDVVKYVFAADDDDDDDDDFDEDNDDDFLLIWNRINKVIGLHGLHGHIDADGYVNGIATLSTLDNAVNLHLLPAIQIRSSSTRSTKRCGLQLSEIPWL